MRSSAWAVLGFGGSQGLSLLTTIVLARLLTPEDFGLVALTLGILAIAYIAQESGLFAALIVHRGEIRPAAASVLVLSPFVSIGLYLLCFATAPILANLLDAPRLTDVFRVTAVVLVLRGLALMPIALLQRDLRFRPLTAIELSGAVAQSATAVVLAGSGAGVWSLVAGQLALGAAQLVLAWWLAPFRPSPFEARRVVLLELMRFGRFVGAANFLSFANSSSEEIVIGRVLGTFTLGYFSLAKRIAALPVQVVGNILGRGVFAALARLQDDAEGFRRVWLENIQRLALLSIPAVLAILIAAEPIVLALFGDKWRPAIVPLQILALGGVVRSFSTTSGEVFQALGRPQLRVYAESAHLALIVPALIAGAHWQGLRGAATAIVLVNVTVGVPVLWTITRVLGVTGRQLVLSVMPAAVGWTLLAVTLLSLRLLVEGLPALLQLLVLLAGGGAVYAAATAIFAREIVATMWRSLRGARITS